MPQLLAWVLMSEFSQGSLWWDSGNPAGFEGTFFHKGLIEVYILKKKKKKRKKEN